MPKNWLGSNLRLLDADFIRFDNTGTATDWLNHFSTEKNYRNWYTHCFGRLRQLLGDGIIRSSRVSAAVGQPNSKDPQRGAEYRRLRMENEDEDVAIAREIKKADSTQRTKDEKQEERQDKLAAHMGSSNEDIFRLFPNLDDLANHLLHQRTKFDQHNIPFCDNTLPFGAKTFFESIQAGVHTKYFHFNICTTTRPLEEGEWHNYMTSSSRNGIFSHANEPDRLGLRASIILHSDEYDLKWVPIFSYIGTNENGGGRILL